MVDNRQQTRQESWQDLGKILARIYLSNSCQDLAKICRKQDFAKILPRSYKIRQDLAKMFNLGACAFIAYSVVS